MKISLCNSGFHPVKIKSSCCCYDHTKVKVHLFTLNVYSFGKYLTKKMRVHVGFFKDY